MTIVCLLVVSVVMVVSYCLILEPLRVGGSSENIDKHMCSVVLYMYMLLACCIFIMYCIPNNNCYCIDVCVNMSMMLMKINE